MGRTIGHRGLIKILLLFLSMSLFLVKNTSAFADNGEIVFVSVPPIAYFVEKIGGETIRVESLINPGDDLTYMSQNRNKWRTFQRQGYIFPQTFL